MLESVSDQVSGCLVAVASQDSQHSRTASNLLSEYIASASGAGFRVDMRTVCDTLQKRQAHAAVLRIGGAGLCSHEFIASGLRHRTRASRRAAVALLQSASGSESWFEPWRAAFEQLSEEQPWHLCQPAWSDALDAGVLDSAPALWVSCLLQRGAAHSDERCAKRLCSDALSLNTQFAAMSDDILRYVVPTAARLVSDAQPWLDLFGRLSADDVCRVVEALCGVPASNAAAEALRTRSATCGWSDAECGQLLAALPAVAAKWYGQGSTRAVELLGTAASGFLDCAVKLCMASGQSAAPHVRSALQTLRYGGTSLLQQEHVHFVLQCVAAVPEGRTQMLYTLARLHPGECVESDARSRASGVDHAVVWAAAVDVGYEGTAHKINESVVLDVVCGAMGADRRTDMWYEVCTAIAVCPSAAIHSKCASVLVDSLGSACVVDVAEHVDWSGVATGLKEAVWRWVMGTSDELRCTGARIAAALPAPLAVAPAAADWLCDSVAEATAALGTAGKRARKCAAASDLYVTAVARAASAYCATHPSASEQLLQRLWQLVQALPRGFRAGRPILAAVFQALCNSSGASSVFAEHPSLLSRCEESSVAAAEFVRAAKSTVADAAILARLIVFAPAPEAKAMSSSHPAVVLLSGEGRLCSAGALVSALTSTDEGDDAESSFRRLRKWWFVCSVMPQLSGADEDVVHAAVAHALDELKLSRAVPRVRVLLQNAVARGIAVVPASGQRLCDILENPQTDTRLAVSAVAAAVQCITMRPQIPDGLRKKIVVGLVGWAHSLPFQARLLAQIGLRDNVFRDDQPAVAVEDYLGIVARFMGSNPHLHELQKEARISRLVSEYLTDPLPYEPPPASVEMALRRAERVVQRRYAELEGEHRETANPSSGCSNSRRCPARAWGRGAPGTGDPDESDTDDASEQSQEQASASAADKAHQQRPTPSRLIAADAVREPSLCVVASFLDNIPNLAGLSRTLEAVFGQDAELALPSLRVLRDPSFLRMSMASEQWLKCVEVPPGGKLEQYLTHKKAAGYQIVALEQTDRSVAAERFTFTRKTVIVIGNEGRGIPAWLLQRDGLVDVFVELPLSGVSRSLNAHVTGAMMLWHYRTQQ
eukprot:TRINITY_DN5914_c0_g1_i1.p1 TRINITY_DN5914_c0_g1~~TRINITY_DN5914_c0_g1_i1.p1  ORF type:complete len:1251 (+),score=178.63 TRINITY_DN5914_c0_g1_i1:424-3753(+)